MHIYFFLYFFIFGLIVYFSFAALTQQTKKTANIFINIDCNNISLGCLGTQLLMGNCFYVCSTSAFNQLSLIKYLYLFFFLFACIQTYIALCLSPRRGFKINPWNWEKDELSFIFEGKSLMF